MTKKAKKKAAKVKRAKAPPLPKYLKLISEIEDIPARIEYVVWATGEHNPPPSAIEDDLDSDGDLIEKAFGTDESAYYDEETDDGLGHRSRQCDQLWEHLCYRFGGWTIVKCSTPIFETYEGSTHRSFSWGYFASSYFAAKSLEEALQKALAWAKKEYESVKVKPRKRAKKKETSDAEA